MRPILWAMALTARLSTPRLLVLVFGVTVLAGALALRLPGVVRPEAAPHTVVDALFMATSAACITGLAVRDIGTDYTWLGQALLLLMVQAGGIGMLTFSKLYLLRHGSRLKLDERALIAASHGSLSVLDPRAVLRQTIVYTLACEGVGALLLLPRLALDSGWAQGAWEALFHSVSAFCNAGLSLWTDSLCRYRDDAWVNGVIMGLVIAGSLGFIVIADLARWIGERHRRANAQLSLHSKVVLATTAILLVGGTLAFALLEARNAALGDTWWQRLLPAGFLSVTTRSVGYNTVPLELLSNQSLLLVIALMVIGGSPGSTAGGIKTTTAAILFAAVRSRWRDRPHAELLGRSLSGRLVAKAMAAAAGMVAALMLAVMALQFTERGLAPHNHAGGHFLDLLFEASSAIATVGLSTGITPLLSDPGKLVISLCMFAGRLGPLLFAMALTHGRRQRLDYTYPKEDVVIS